MAELNELRNSSMTRNCPQIGILQLKSKKLGFELNSPLIENIKLVDWSFTLSKSGKYRMKFNTEKVVECGKRFHSAQLVLKNRISPLEFDLTRKFWIYSTH